MKNSKILFTVFSFVYLMVYLKDSESLIPPVTYRLKHPQPYDF